MADALEIWYGLFPEARPPVVTAETVGDLDDQLVNGPYCRVHGRVGATIDGKCGQCYGVGRMLDDRLAKLEAENAALLTVIVRLTPHRYIVVSESGYTHSTSYLLDSDTVIVDLHEGPF